MTPLRVAVPALLCALAAGAGTAAGAQLRDIVRGVETQYRDVSSHGRLRLEVATGHWRRTLLVETWSRGDREFLARILEPARERGVATLRSGGDVWNYLPRVDRTVKVPSSLLAEGWMGSHVTNDDLVRAHRVEEDYDFTLVEERGGDGGGAILVIDALPKPGAPVVWGRIRYAIARGTGLPRTIEYFDEDGAPVRSARFEEPRDFGGRTLPSRVVVLPLDRPGERTVLTYEELALGVDLPRDLFTLGALRKP